MLWAGTSPCRGDIDPSKGVAQALIRLQAHQAVAAHVLGEDGVQLLGDRLADDLEGFDGAIPPPGFSQSAWTERLNTLAVLDASIVQQVLDGKREPLAGVQGLAERLLVSRVDGTWQPIAVYVPQHLDPHPSLVVLLHGRPQTESEILSSPYFRKLADATGTIVAAPWGRGHYDFFGVAADDVYQTADDVASAYNIDTSRVFLVGYSMGGFAVFKVGPIRGERWAAVMSISGSILNSETTAFLKAFYRKNIYVVNGKLDDAIPPQFGESTAQFLASQGMNVGFYQEPTGTHMIPTFIPSLTKAWNDMLSGAVHNTPGRQAAKMTLPAFTPPGPTLKP